MCPPKGDSDDNPAQPKGTAVKPKATKPAQIRPCVPCGKSKKKACDRKTPCNNCKADDIEAQCAPPPDMTTRTCSGCDKVKTVTIWSRSIKGVKATGNEYYCSACYQGGAVTRKCDGCQEEKTQVKWYHSMGGVERTGDELYCQKCHKVEATEKKCDGCQEVKTQPQWFRSIKGMERTGDEYYCEKCYRGERKAVTKNCDGCQEEKTQPQWFRSIRGVEGTSGGFYCEKCYLGKAETKKCDGCQEEKTQPQWFRSKGGVKGTGDEYYCRKCYRGESEAETKKCDDCQEVKTEVHWYRSKGGVKGTGDEYYCKKCYRGRQRATGTSAAIEAVVNTSLDSFFFRSRMVDPRLPERFAAAVLDQSVASPPYTRQTAYWIGGAHREKGQYAITTIHDWGAEPEKDSTKLDEAIKAKLDGKLRPGKSQQTDAGYTDIPPTDYIELGGDYFMPGLNSGLDGMSLARIEDHRTQAAIAARAFGDEPKREDPRLDYETKYMEEFRQSFEYGSKKPIMIPIARTSSRVPQWMVNVLHLENQIVRNDYYQARRAAEAQDPNLAVVPDYGQSFSLVLNGESAWAPFPVHFAPNQTLAQRMLIHILDHAAAHGLEVMLLPRGVPGHSVAPNVYARIHQRWPNLVVRVAYTLRPQFLANANCALPLALQAAPFRLQVAPMSARHFYHSCMINIRDMVDQYQGTLHSPMIQQLLDFHDEEYDARTGGLPWAVAAAVRYIRGAGRNDVN
ncbi:hypothetical protein LTR15_011805 [Elasticomyces elasticus]|nr:hypothetical protein LTR15_011805 [Elasticomyces elasticus]